MALHHARCRYGYDETECRSQSSWLWKPFRCCKTSWTLNWAWTLKWTKTWTARFALTTARAEINSYNCGATCNSGSRVSLREASCLLLFKYLFAHACKILSACTVPLLLILYTLLCLEYDLFYRSLLFSVLLKHALLSYWIMCLQMMSHPTLLVFLHFTSCLSSPLTLSFHSIPPTAAFYHRKNTRGPLNIESTLRALSPLHHNRLYGL